jgi:hypothetical protein
MKAEASGQHKLAQLFERRFRPEFRVAFEAWKKTDPLNNPDAPPGPLMMPEYHNAKSEESAKLESKPLSSFSKGQRPARLPMLTCELRSCWRQFYC